MIPWWAAGILGFTITWIVAALFVWGFVPWVIKQWRKR